MSRSSEFLKWFWDLASDSISIRQNAIENILSHLVSIPIDIEYTYKRLIKGLSSSRASARLGFSVCLTSILSTYNTSLSIQDILQTIEDSNKLVGSIRGMDEREFMFGKLFGYSAIIQSNRLTTMSSDEILDLIQRIMKIHKMRGWIREMTIEILLLILSKIHQDLQEQVIQLLSSLLLELNVEGDMHGWQIILILGLQSYTQHSQSNNNLPTINLLQHPTQALVELSPSLLSATSGFPKLHRVWDCILNEIFPFDNERVLPTTR
jgi:DNA polymerase phi